MKNGLILIGALLLPATALAGPDGLTCGEYNEIAASAGVEGVNETAQLTLDIAFDKFPKEIAEGLYEQWKAEGVVNAYETSLTIYTQSKQASDMGKSVADDIIAEKGIPGLMTRFCHKPETSFKGIAYTLALAATQILTDPEEPSRK